VGIILVDYAMISSVVHKLIAFLGKFRRRYFARNFIQCKKKDKGVIKHLGEILNAFFVEIYSIIGSFPPQTSPASVRSAYAPHRAIGNSARCQAPPAFFPS